MEHGLEGRTVFVTGAAGGFGRVLTAAYLKAGANVTAADVSPEGLAALQRSLEEVGHAARSVRSTYLIVKPARRPSRKHAPTSAA